MRKTCSICRTNKPLSEFERDSRKRDGRGSRCLACNRRRWNTNWGRNYRRRNLEKERARSRRKWHKLRADPQRYAKYRRSPKALSRLALQNAVKRGYIEKPDVCSACQEVKGRYRIHGHHQDYAKPFEVEWLCAACHALKHRPLADQPEEG